MEMLAMTHKHTGACFCGAVELEVTGAPEAMGYCHCASCRSWSAGPVNAFTLWKPENVKVTKGSDKVGHFVGSGSGVDSTSSVARFTAPGELDEVDEISPLPRR
jgi:hypothetical protein